MKVFSLGHVSESYGILDWPETNRPIYVCVMSLNTPSAIRSAIAEIVSDGFTPSAVGITDASAMYNPGYVPAWPPALELKTRPHSSTTPAFASVPIGHPPSGWLVTATGGSGP